MALTTRVAILNEIVIRSHLSRPRHVKRRMLTRTHVDCRLFVRNWQAPRRCEAADRRAHSKFCVHSVRGERL